MIYIRLTTMENSREFAAIILTHGRPKSVTTYKTLRKQGYTGRIVVLIDDEDESGPEYIKNYPSEVVVFCKGAAAKHTDTGDNSPKMNTVLFARNAVFDVAKAQGLTHFVMLDDDYSSFVYKFDADFRYQESPIKSLDAMFNLFVDYFEQINCKSIAFAQNGDFIGGKNSGFATVIKPRRKCMNTFICGVARPFKFVARMNDDVTTYVIDGMRGDLFLTIPNVAIIQKQTQASEGGLTEMYLESGTYVKSFYTVMFAPSCTKIAEMGDKHRRLHHKIKWSNAVPAILAEEHKK